MESSGRLPLSDHFNFPLPHFKNEQEEGSHAPWLSPQGLLLNEGQALKKAAGAGMGLQTSKNPPAMLIFQLLAIGSARALEELIGAGGCCLLFISVWGGHA